MATIRLQYSEQFHFKNPDSWKRCFEQYHVASRLATENEARHVSTLIEWGGGGRDAESVLTSKGISDADKVQTGREQTGRIFF